MKIVFNQSMNVLFAAAVLTAASGSQCHRRDYNNYTTYGPRVLTQNPTLGDVVQVVNDNNAKIRTLFTTDATLTVTGAPSLRANLALERQKKLRLRAETALTGAEVDLGSNDDLFWFWVRRNPPPTIYYCRHSQFEQSAAKQMVPIDPVFLFDALGLAWFDPSLQHSPPQRNAQGRLEITTQLPGPTGTKSKKTVVDEARGWVMEQHLYDERGVLIASAMTNRHTIDLASGAVVPQEIDVVWPATQFRLKFDVKQWTVNNTPADPAQLYTMPTVAGWSVVDLADPRLMNPTTNPNLTAPIPTPVSINGGSAPAVGQNGSAWGTTAAAPAYGYAGPTGGVPQAGVMGPMFSPPVAGAPAAPGGFPSSSGATTGLTPITPAAPASSRY